mmetsp:Transcript_46359/g.148918  ORF Transcript_46359/g.148918 Transcript_46359/m.148918 type:complete len:261 (+) Transcript_46359:955-1737(+)
MTKPRCHQHGGAAILVSRVLLRPCSAQKADHIRKSFLRGRRESGATEGVGGIQRSLGLPQEFHHLQVSCEGCQVHRCLALPITSILAHSRVAQKLHDLDMAALRSRVQRRVPCNALAVERGCRLAEKSQHLHVSTRGCQIQGAAALYVARVSVGPGIEEEPEHVELSVLRHQMHGRDFAIDLCVLLLHADILKNFGGGRVARVAQEIDRFLVEAVATHAHRLLLASSLHGLKVQVRAPLQQRLHKAKPLPQPTRLPELLR